MPACVETLEQLITVPMEQDLPNGVAFLKPDRVGITARGSRRSSSPSSLAPICWMHARWWQSD